MRSISKGLVSIIVPNHGRDLTLLKNSIANSSYTNTELVVVDEGFERSKQRNIGMDRAKGEYLLFLDSDHYIHPHLIWECVILTKEYDALYIPEEITTKGFFGRLRNWERQFYTGTCIDVVRFVRNKNCPYFDEIMSGPEDSDFDRRVIGKKGTTTFPLYHQDDVTFLDYCKKKAYYTKSMAKFDEKNPNDKCVNLKYRCWTVFVENSKWKRLLRHPIYTIALIGLLAVRGIILIWNKH